MKSWITVTTFVVISIAVLNNAFEIPDHLRKQMKKLHKRCQNQTNTPNDILKETEKGVLPKNKNFECYMQCLFELMGIMDGSNSIQLENLLQIVPEEFHSTINMLAQACGTKEGSDKCNIAYNTMQCYAENNPIAIQKNLDFLFN